MFRVTSSIRTLSHTIQPFIEPYFTSRLTEFQNITANQHQLYQGTFTREGSQSFSVKNPKVQFKPLMTNHGIKVSDIGVGSYRGSLDQEDDILQFNGIIDSVMLGCNVIDTCRNFRGGRSEQSIGKALKYLIETKNYKRNELFLMSKAGYVRQTLPNQLQGEVVNHHCVHPDYLEESLKKTLQALNVKSLDVFYLNNFAQCQLQTLGKEKFEYKLCKSFQFLEKCKQQNKIKYYGLASWNSFRVSQKDPNHVNLASIMKLAEKVNGSNHSFKFIQIPINIMMPQAFAQKNQQAGSVLQTAENLRLNVISCSPLMSGTLIHTPLSSDKLDCRNNGAKHLQIIRSIPSESLICSLIGHKRLRHVKKNLEVLEVPKLTEQRWFKFFVPQEEPHQIQS